MPNTNPFANCIDGVCYEADVPDTLDLADRLGLAVNALTNVWYPDEKWASGFLVDFSRRPPIMYPQHIMDAYLNIPPKFVEALAACRLAPGSDQNIDVDREVLGVQVEMLAENGLSYCPGNTLAEFSEKRPFSSIWGEGRMILAYWMLAQVDPSGPWTEIGQRKVDRLL